MFSVFNAQNLKAGFEDQTDQKRYTSIRPVQKKASFEMCGGLHVFPLHYL